MQIGFLNPLYDAVAWVIIKIHDGLSPLFGGSSGLTWALSIVFLVVLMRLIMVPLFIKQMHTTRAMTALTPKITELRKKYKGDKQKLNEETMKLYQQAGVNPLMGCLPIVLQLPIFFALFSVLREIASYAHKSGTIPRYHLTWPLIKSAQHAKIFGATIADKFLFPLAHHPVSTQAKAVILVTVVISMVTTYLTMRQSVKRGMMPTGSDNPMGQSQKIMTYVMPLFALSGLYWPFGLVLYWVTTNVWTLGQQYVLLRKYPVGAAVLPGGGAAGPAPFAGPGRPSGPGGPSGPRRRLFGPLRAGGGQGGPSGGKAMPGDARLKGEEPSANGTGPPRRQKPRPAQAAADGAAASSDGGVRRRFGKARPEPPPPEPPAAKLVRQPRQRQPRSKRTGKR